MITCLRVKNILAYVVQHHHYFYYNNQLHSTFIINDDHLIRFINDLFTKSIQKKTKRIFKTLDTQKVNVYCNTFEMKKKNVIHLTQFFFFILIYLTISCHHYIISSFIRAQYFIGFRCLHFCSTIIYSYGGWTTTCDCETLNLVYKWRLVFRSEFQLRVYGPVTMHHRNTNMCTKSHITRYARRIRK